MDEANNIKRLAGENSKRSGLINAFHGLCFRTLKELYGNSLNAEQGIQLRNRVDIVANNPPWFWKRG